MTTVRYSLQELADSVNTWCREHGIAPLHNRVGEQVTVRNIRYYQSLGLVDRPDAANGRGYSDKHRLQLLALRLLQARGLTLDRIQSILQGLSIEQLQVMQHGGIDQLALGMPPSPGPTRSWQVAALSDEFLLLSCAGRKVTDAQRQHILDILTPAAEPLNHSELSQTFRPEID